MIHIRTALKDNIFFFTLIIFSMTLCACAQKKSHTLITIADARNNPAHFIDNGEPGDSAGDILVFEQPLLDKEMKEIGNNSGSCIRTRVAHSYQCQWTLTFDDEFQNGGTIQVAGREQDKGISNISIVGGTGRYSGISGEMESTNNNNGTFTQVLNYTLNN